MDKVLIIVSGGVADYVVDGDVSVEVFDWDNYKSDPEATGRVSEEFADLARGAGLPCEGDVDD